MNAGGQPSKDSRWAARLAGCAVLTAAAFWIYTPALRGGWLWDDPVEVTGNTALRTLSGLRSIWTGGAGVDYWPLTGTIRWMQWHAWGLDALGYHVTNVVLHVLGALLLWKAVEALGGPKARLAGFIAGLIFAVHPVAVESVAWVSELKNVLSLPFMLLAFLAYIAFDKSGRTRDGLQSLGWFLAALLSKSSTVMLPCALLLFSWWKRGRLRRRDFTRTLPFFAASAVSAVVTLWFQAHRALPGLYSRSAGGHPGLTADAAKTAVLAAVFYLGKCLWPLKLAPVYPALGAATLPPRAEGPFRPAARAAVFGLGCFFLNLVPVLGLVPMAYQRYSPVADHLAYIPLACLAALAGAALAALPRGAGLCAAVLLAGLLAAESHLYSPVFGGPTAFWSYAAARNPNAAVAHYNLGTELAQEGRYSEAISELEQAVRIEPAKFEAQTNLAGLLWLEGRRDEALAHFRAALRANPGSAVAHNDLGIVLWQLHRVDEAIVEFEGALRLEPGLRQARQNLIAAYEAAGRFEDASALRNSPK